MNYKTLAEEILKTNRELFERGFISRAKIAASPTNFTNRIPTLSEPAYLTDLGVRRFEDPKQIFEKNMKRKRLSDFYDRASSEKLLLDLPICYLASELDKYLLFIGDYPSCSNIIHARRSEILNSGDYELLVYSGTIEGALSLAKSIDFFEVAFHSTTLIENKFLALHRKAIVQLKRLKDYEGTEDSLNTLLREVQDSFDSGLISEGDLSGFIEMANNARALSYVVRNQPEVARRYLPKGHHLRPRENLRVLDFDQSCRYQAQENINLAQLSLGQNKHSEAIEILKDTTVFCALWAQNYVSESLSILAYALFLHKEYQLSLILGLQSAKLIQEESSPTRYLKNLEVIVASIHELGFEEEALQVWRKFKETATLN